MQGETHVTDRESGEIVQVLHEDGSEILVCQVCQRHLRAQDVDCLHCGCTYAIPLRSYYEGGGSPDA